MDSHSSIELLRAFGGALRKELPVEANLPVDIKLLLGRLMLKELLGEMRARDVAERGSRPWRAR